MTFKSYEKTLNIDNCNIIKIIVNLDKNTNNKKTEINISYEEKDILVSPMFEDLSENKIIGYLNNKCIIEKPVLFKILMNFDNINEIILVSFDGYTKSEIVYFKK
jgi:hypothetical protein